MCVWFIPVQQFVKPVVPLLCEKVDNPVAESIEEIFNYRLVEISSINSYLTVFHICLLGF